MIAFIDSSWRETQRGYARDMLRAEEIWRSTALIFIVLLLILLMRSAVFAEREKFRLTFGKVVEITRLMIIPS